MTQYDLNMFFKICLYLIKFSNCCYSLLCVGFGWRGSGAVRSDGMSWRLFGDGFSSLCSCLGFGCCLVIVYFSMRLWSDWWDLLG